MLRDRRMIYTRGEGCRLWDAEGNEYLDAVSGTNGVALVGHSNPRVADAVAAQFKQLSSHFLNTASPPQIELARRISETAPTGPSKTYLCPGGGEAVEAALKLAMRITGRGEVFSLHGGYHGTGFGGLGLLGLPQVREWFPGGIRWPTLPAGAERRPVPPDGGRGRRLAPRGARPRGRDRLRHLQQRRRGHPRARPGARRPRRVPAPSTCRRSAASPPRAASC